MLQTINCQLIFALIHCAYVAGNILYCIHTCIYIYLYSNTPFSRHSVNVIGGNRWENMLGLGLLSLSSPPSPYQTNHKNRISFRLFISVSLFPSSFLCFLLCFYRQQSVKWRCLLSFQLWRKTWQIKMRIHSSHALRGGAKRGLGKGGGGCVYTCNARSNIIVIKKLFALKAEV